MDLNSKTSQQRTKEVKNIQIAFLLFSFLKRIHVDPFKHKVNTDVDVS